MHKCSICKNSFHIHCLPNAYISEHNFESDDDEIVCNKCYRLESDEDCSDLMEFGIANEDNDSDNSVINENDEEDINTICEELGIFK